jgi:hypothetical protein
MHVAPAYGEGSENFGSYVYIHPRTTLLLNIYKVIKTDYKPNMQRKDNKTIGGARKINNCDGYFLG